jgi:NB-ARC domain
VSNRPDASNPSQSAFTNVQAENITIEGDFTQIQFNEAPSKRFMPFHALPSIPKHFVPRSQPINQVKKYLLSDEESLPGTLVLSAICGLGGIGKSVLASAIAHDSEIQKRFSDGILGVTLGQDPDILSALGGWIQALHDFTYKLTTVDMASRHLNTLLRDKKVLLVVDDAWHSAHVEPFRVGGQNCRLLITTREAFIPDANRYDLDVMSEDESLELLEKFLNRSLADVERQNASDFARAIGYLPLALELAAAQVQDGFRWDELTNEFRAEVAQLELLDSPQVGQNLIEKDDRKYSLRACFRLTLRQLSPEMLSYFSWLGVLPEDATITPQMAATLWNATHLKAKKTLQTLKSKALLTQIKVSHSDSVTYRLHDLMHDTARWLLTQPQDAEISGLELSLETAQQLFLERYRLQTTDGLWHTLEDDGYIHTHLTWHMEKAGRTNEIHQLLQEQTSQGKNGWYEACDRLGQTAQFISDVSRAWRIAEEAYAEDATKSLGLQVRYMLIISSVSSYAEFIPAALISALVEKKIWHPIQGLTYAKQTPGGVHPEAIQVLSKYLPTHLLSEALDLARGIYWEDSRIIAMSALSVRLPEMLPEVLKMIQMATSEKEAYIDLDLGIGEAVCTLATHLPETFILEFLEIVQKMHSYKNKAVCALVSHLPTVFLPKVLEALRELQDEAFRAEVLSELTIRLPQPSVPKSLEMIQEIQDEGQRAYVFSKIAAILPELLVPEALEAARRIPSESFRAEVLSNWTAYRPEIIPEAIDTAQRIKDLNDRARALRQLTAYLPEVLLEETFLGILKLCIRQNLSDLVFSPLTFINALSQLAMYIPDSLMHKALQIVQRAPNKCNQVVTLSALGVHQPKISLEALEWIRNIEDEDERIEMFFFMAVHLPEGIPEALELLRRTDTGDQDDRSWTLRPLVLHPPESLVNLPESVIAKMLEVAREINDKNSQAVALSRLVVHLPEILPEVLGAIRRMQGMYRHSHKSEAVVALAGHLPEALISEVLEVIREIENDYYFQSKAFCALAGHSPDILPEALEVIRGIEDASNRVKVSSKLLSNLPKISPEVLVAILGLEKESEKAVELSKLDYLPEVLMLEALDVLWGIPDDDKAQALMLAALSAHLPEVLMPEALELVRGIEERYRAYTLNELVAYLPEVLLPEALEVARGMDEYYRAEALSGLTTHLPEILPEALEAARSGWSGSRIFAFSSLAKHLNLHLFDLSLFSELLSIMSQSNRKAVLEELPNLIPAAIALSDPSVVKLIAQAIKDVCQQWP